MPFEVITLPSVALTHPVASGDYVVVTMSTRSNLLFSPYRHRYGQFRLQLSRDTWTKEVRDMIKSISEELSKRGRPPVTSDFSVVLDDQEVLAVDRPVNVTVIYGRMANKEFGLRLRGTPRAFRTGRTRSL